MQITFGSFRVDSDTRQLLRDGIPVRLTPKAFELLLVLVQNRPRAMSKAALTERIWPGVYVTEQGLVRLVNEIRKAIGDSAASPSWLRTVHGFGYAFSEEDRCPKGGLHLTWGNRDVPLAEGEHLIGRDPSASVRLRDSVISRQHAKIVVCAGCATLEDLHSKNGTFIGDTRLNGPRQLEDGDEIRVGGFTLTFRAHASLTTQTLSR